MKINLMKPFLTTFLMALVCQTLFAQYNISGNLNDQKGEALGFANVLLLNASDSAFVLGTTTDSDGKFTLSTSKEGDFILSISMIGYDTYYSETFAFNASNSEKNFSTIALQEGGVEVGTVEVVGEKPLFERKIDRTVINLENRVVSAGATALEVLERAPGVIVDRNTNTISMLGKDGVNVMINGRLSYMPTDALVQFLQGMNADNIISIELITTPPARFDAQGNAGYINIVLKKNPNDGLNGNYSVTAGYGRGEVLNGSINFNYRKNRVNLFGGYNYSRNAQDQLFEFESRYGTGENLIESTTFSPRDPMQNNHNGRLGLDYEIREKTTVGVLIAGYDNRWHMNVENIGTFTSPSVDSFSTILITEDNNWQHFQANFNLAHEFQDGGKLNFDVDYLFYTNENPSDYDLAFRDASDVETSSRTLFSTKTTPFTIRVGQLDYEKNITEKFHWSSGLKMVQSDFENDVIIKENDVELTDLTSVSNLTENIYAAYTQGRYQANDKIGFQVGLRYEFTDTELNSSNEGKVVDREFGSLFPSVYFDYKINENNGINLSYSRRINRPSFSNMAPFVFFFDPNTLSSGNPAIQPAISNSLEVNYRIKRINLTVQYTAVDSAIAGFQSRFDVETNTQIIMPVNLKERNLFVTSVSLPVKVTDWWNMRLFGLYMWQENVTVEELGTFTLRRNVFRLSGNQTFTLPKDFSVELSGFYTSPFVNGNLQIGTIWGLNFGLQKQLSNGRLAFNIGDIFNTIRSEGITEIPEENIYAYRAFDFSQQTFRLTYSTSFGNQKVKRARNRNSSREERNRVN